MMVVGREHMGARERMRNAARGALALFSFGSLPRPSSRGEENSYEYGPELQFGTGQDVLTAVPAAFSAVELRASSMSRCRMGAGRRAEDYSKLTEYDDGHPATALVRHSPNRRIDVQQFWNHFFTQLFANGNSYAWIRRDKYGYPIELVPAADLYARRAQSLARRPETEASRPFVYDLRLWGNTQFATDLTGQVKVGVPERDVLHLHWSVFDGRYSPSPIRTHARRALETSARAAEHQVTALREGLFNRLFMKRDASAVDGPDQRKSLRESLRETHGGSSKAGKVVVLPPGVEPAAVGGLSAADVALIELEKWGVGEICRCFHVPPRMLYFYERGMRAQPSFEAASLDFVKWSIMPWAERASAQFTAKLLNADDRTAGLSMLVDPAPLSRGTESEELAKAAQAAQAGIVTINEARAKIGLAPVEGGDDLMRQVGAGDPLPAEGADAPPEDPPEDSPQPGARLNGRGNGAHVV